MSVATQLVLYANDAVDICYADGSRLQLSPCATTFVHQQPINSSEHPLQCEKKIQQRVQFVTSKYRNQVQEALDFRNRFAQHPYLCKDVLNEFDVIKLHADVSELAWPSSLGDAELCLLPGGNIRLASMDEYGALTLAPHHQYFTIEYLAKVSQKVIKQRNTPHYRLIRQSPSPDESAEPVIYSSGKSDVFSNDDTNDKWNYVWLVKHYSVQECPNYWQHPLQLLIDFVTPLDSSLASLEKSILELQRKRNTTLYTDESAATASVENEKTNACTVQAINAKDVEPCGYKKEIDESSDGNLRTEGSSEITGSSSLRKLLKRDFSDCVFSQVPMTLPLNCTAQHLHKWQVHTVSEFDDTPGDTAYLHGRVKVICSSGIIYRLLWCNPRAVEIYPGDGSLIKSSGMVGQYFTHYICSAGQVEQRMYSVKSPPPHTPGIQYSVAKLITRAARFLNQVCEESLQLIVKEEECCWQHADTDVCLVNPQPTVLLEECKVEGLGRFSAFSNGHIRVVFSDRTCLDMCSDPSSRPFLDETHTNQEGNQGNEFFLRKYHKLSPSQVLDIPKGMCRLLLPTGHYQMVPLDKPEGYYSYVEAARQWSKWVNCAPGDRYHFYKDTIYDPEKHITVETELKKIQCFNYLVENLTPRFATAHINNDTSASFSSAVENHLPGTDADLDFAAVEKALKNTAAAVKELDSLLTVKHEACNT